MAAEWSTKTGLTTRIASACHEGNGRAARPSRRASPRSWKQARAGVGSGDCGRVATRSSRRGRWCRPANGPPAATSPRRFRPFQCSSQRVVLRPSDVTGRGQRPQPKSALVCSSGDGGRPHLWARGVGVPCLFLRADRHPAFSSGRPARKMVADAACRGPRGARRFLDRRFSVRRNEREWPSLPVAGGNHAQSRQGRNVHRTR